MGFGGGTGGRAGCYRHRKWRWKAWGPHAGSNRLWQRRLLLSPPTTWRVRQLPLSMAIHLTYCRWQQRLPPTVVWEGGWCINLKNYLSDINFWKFMKKSTREAEVSLSRAACRTRISPCHKPSAESAVQRCIKGNGKSWTSRAPCPTVPSLTSYHPNFDIPEANMQRVIDLFFHNKLKYSVLNF